MQELLHFNKMITPSIIKVLYWIALVAAVIAGIVAMTENFFQGLLMIIFLPVVIRIYAEIFLVIFQINNTLTDVKTALQRKK